MGQTRLTRLVLQLHFFVRESLDLPLQLVDACPEVADMTSDTPPDPSDYRAKNRTDHTCKLELILPSHDCLSPSRISGAGLVGDRRDQSLPQQGGNQGKISLENRLLGKADQQGSRADLRGIIPAGIVARLGGGFTRDREKATQVCFKTVKVSCCFQHFHQWTRVGSCAVE